MRRGSCLVANWLEGIVLDCTNDLVLVMQPVTPGFDVDGRGSLNDSGSYEYRVGCLRFEGLFESDLALRKRFGAL